MSLSSNSALIQPSSEVEQKMFKEVKAIASLRGRKVLNFFSQKERKALTKFFSSNIEPFNNLGGTRAEKTFLIYQLIENVESLKDNELSKKVMSLAFPRGQDHPKNLSALQSTLRNAGANTLCIRKVLPPVIAYVKHYAHLFADKKTSFGGLPTIFE